MVRTSTGIALLMLVCLSAASCGGLNEPAPLPRLDQHAFRCRVEPVLVARCAFFACHGSARRPFRIYAVQRLRLDVGRKERNKALDDRERAANYDAARAFVRDGPGASSLLLKKPLDVGAGGFFHISKSQHGVFASPTDRGYRWIADWIADNDKLPASCTPTTEVGP